MSQPRSIVLFSKDEHTCHLLRTWVAGRKTHLFVEPKTLEEMLTVINAGNIDLAVIDVMASHVSGPQVLRAITSLSAELRPKRVLAISDIIAPGAVGGHQNLFFMAQPAQPGLLLEYIKKNFSDSESQPKTENSSNSSAIKIDANLFNLFVQGMQLVFSKTANIEIKKERMFLRKNERVSADFGALIEIKSKIFDAKMAIFVSQETFIQITNSLFNETADTSTPESFDKADLVCELCNQVYGYVKRELSEKFALQPALPQLLIGQQCFFEPPSSKHVQMAIKFSSPYGPILLELIFTRYQSGTTLA